MFRAQAEKAVHPRFVTLTAPLVPYTASLKEAVQRRRAAFSRLRKHPVMASAVGGVYAFEVTLRRDGFHLHLHVLLDAAWIENRKGRNDRLEDAWRLALEREGEALADDKRVVVHIRKATRHALREALKYTVKGMASPKDGAERPTPLDTGGKDRGLAPSEIPPEALRELVEVMEGGVHLVEPFGDWRGCVGEYRKSRDAEKPERQPRLCPKCGVRELIPAFRLSWGSPWWETVDGMVEFQGPQSFAWTLHDRLEIEDAFRAWKASPAASQEIAL